MADREQLETFLVAINASSLALHRPNCRGWLGDYQITGKHGHVLPDGTGFLLYAGWEGSPKRWTYAKKRLGFCRLTQNGDDEGCLHLDRLPTEPEAEIIRDVLGIRKSPGSGAADHLRSSRFGSAGNG
jgi:hypothetical protein